MKYTLRLMATALLGLSLSHSAVRAAEIFQPSGVVELFTSQGCSSCPPADKLLGQLAKENDTLALAWHVDYWDYLGWKDSFGSKSNTQRQRRYATTLGETQIYTPQAIINGRTHVVGSREHQVRAALKRFKGTKQGLTVPISATFSDDIMTVSVANTPEAADATLWIIYFDNQRVVEIKRGENHGKKLTYSNIVKDVQMVGMIKGSAINTTLPLSEIKRKGTDSCALVLQKNTKYGTPGPIIGAAIIRDL